MPNTGGGISQGWVMHFGSQREKEPHGDTATHRQT